MWRKIQRTWRCETSGSLLHTVPSQLTTLGDPHNYEQTSGYLLNSEPTISSDRFNLHQPDIYSHIRREPLIEHNTTSIIQAPRERSFPLAISELINQDSEPQSLTRSRNTETDMSFARAHSTGAARHLTTQIQPDFGHESRVLEIPPNFNQCEYGTIPSASQNEMDLCAQFDSGRIPLAFNQFDYGTIPSVIEDDMDLCDQFDAGRAPFFNPSHGTMSSTTQSEGQFEGLRNYASNLTYHQRPMLSVF